MLKELTDEHECNMSPSVTVAEDWREHVKWELYEKHVWRQSRLVFLPCV